MNSDRSSAALDLTSLATSSAAVMLGDEMLRLPSAAAARRSAQLLWGNEITLPAEFLAVVGTGIGLPLVTLVGSTVPLAVAIPSRLALLESSGLAARDAHGAARRRYRELQSVLVRSLEGDAATGAAALVRGTWGADGGPRRWAETARRLLDRAAALNRAALEGYGADGLEGAALDAVAAAWPPLVAPDFARLAVTLAGRAVAADDYLQRYHALFAEVLGMTREEAVA